MKFALSKEHHDFFQNQGYIQFDGFLSKDQIDSLSHSIDKALEHKLNLDQSKISSLSAEQLFLQGRDLWRQNDELRKWACQQRFAATAAELTRKRMLRLGYDQLMPGQQPNHLLTGSYQQFLDQEISLEAMSCVSNVACGLIISLSDGIKKEEEPNASVQGIDLFPFKTGNAVFVTPQTLINLRSIFQHTGQRFYFIIYTDQAAWYLLQPCDPHTHDWKQELGYSFNEKLSDKRHPIVYR